MSLCPILFFFFFFNDTATTEIYTLSLHDALPIYVVVHRILGDGQLVVLLDPALFLDRGRLQVHPDRLEAGQLRSEEHTSELQSRLHLVCRLLLEKKKNRLTNTHLILVAYYRARL